MLPFVGRLGSRPRLVGRIGSLRVSVSFQQKYPPGSVLRCSTAAENGVMTKGVVSGGVWPPSRAYNENAASHLPKPENIDELKKFLQLIWDQGPAATGLDQQSHIELPENTSGLCESWWWTVDTSYTYAEMNYLSDFCICNNSQCFMTMKITSCCSVPKLKIWHRIFI